MPEVIKAAKKIYYNKLFTRSKNKVKAMWNVARSETNKQGNNNELPLNIEGETVTDVQELAKTFNGQETGASTGSVRMRTMPIPTNMLCTLTFISKNLAHGTGLPGPQGVCTTVDTGSSLVHWLGATFIRVSISILQRKNEQGGWELLDVAAKCRALLLSRMWAQGQREWSATAAWLQYWHLLGTCDNPHVGRIPRTMGYLHMYAQWPITIHLRRHNLQTMRNFI